MQEVDEELAEVLSTRNWQSFTKYSINQRSNIIE